MSFPITHWARLYVASILTLVFVAVGLLAASSDAFSGERGSRPPQAPANSRATVNAGRGPATVVKAGPYALNVHLTPNRAASPEIVSMTLRKGGHPVSGARVRLTFSMVDMPEMGGLTGLLPQTTPATYAHAGPTLMSGRWELRFDVAPPGGARFAATVVYRVSA